MTTNAITAALVERPTTPHRWLAPLALCAVVIMVAEILLGPVNLSLADAAASLMGDGDAATTAIVVHLRLPRVFIGMAAGLALGMGGAVLQGLLRNPLADPGLIGISAGAATGAVAVIVLGDAFLGGIGSNLRPFVLPVAAFFGAALVTAAVFSLARRARLNAIGVLILAGVAITAIADAFIGLMVFISDDQQLRELTFWMRGALSAAGWPLVAVVVPLALLACAMMYRLHRALDVFQLGERAAFHAGYNVESTLQRAGLLVALAVGVTTAAVGPLGFIGLVAPHLARLIFGAGHRLLLPASGMIGVCLVLMADLFVRLVVPPAEPPIGLATSLIGGPFFLWLLLRHIQSGDRHA